MIALALADAKTITAHLFLKDTFDRFCLIEGEIITFNTFHIDGHVHRDFFDTTGPGDDENGTTAPGEYSFWGSLRNHWIRPENVQGLYLNFHFDGTALTCVTGTSFRTFTMDKSLEHIWDEMAQKFFRQHQIPFEIK